jgi:hypothetical protein
MIDLAPAQSAGWHGGPGEQQAMTGVDMKNNAAMNADKKKKPRKSYARRHGNFDVFAVVFKAVPQMVLR